MKYIFEDGKEDAISKLFESLYSEDIVSNFIYTNGNGRINQELDLIPENEDVSVFMDLMPDNRDTARIYMKLAQYKKKFKTFIVYPIPCREYYYIKSLYNTQAMNRGYADSIKRCLDIEYYTKSDILSTEQDRKAARNFEKFCKIVAIKGFIDCAKLSGQCIRYFNNDCICSNTNECMQNITIYDKLESFLAAYPCIPHGSEIKSAIPISLEDCVNIHMVLVDTYNKACDEFTNYGIKCKKVPYLFKI